MNKTTYLTVAGIIILLVGGLYYFMKEENPAPPVSQPAAQSQENKFSFSGNTMVEEKDGKKIWEFSADAIEYDPATKQAGIKNIKAVFYQEDGGKVELTADQAVMDSETKDLSMEGSIKALASNGAVLSVKKLSYRGQERRFFGDGDVKLVKDDTVISGDRIESDDKFEKIKVAGHALVQKREGLQ